MPGATSVMLYALGSAVAMDAGSTATGADQVWPASSDQKLATCSPELPSAPALPVIVQIQRPDGITSQ